MSIRDWRDGDGGVTCKSGTDGVASGLGNSTVMVLGASADNKGQ
jgi:hypothetical protein